MQVYKSKMKLITLKEEPSEYLKAKIKSSKDAYNVIKQFYSDDINIYESCFLLLLNRANITVGHVKISSGGIGVTVIDPQMVAKYAIETLASGVILAHNHPSGNLKPSESDIRVTTKIKDTLKIFDCTLLDHIILTDETYFSMSDNGIIL